jgi:hypothetical protein
LSVVCRAAATRLAATRSSSFRISVVLICMQHTGDTTSSNEERKTP